MWKNGGVMSLAVPFIASCVCLAGAAAAIFYGASRN
jgi:hypothetical protein